MKILILLSCLTTCCSLAVGQNILFDATPPVFNRLGEEVRPLLEEKSKALSSHYRDLEPEARRKAIRQDLYRFALARGSVSLPWKDGEIAYLDNLCEEAAKPYDVVAPPRPVKGSAPAVRTYANDDFVIKKWHSGKVRGQDAMVWATRDPANPSNLLVDVSEQMPEVQIMFGGATPPIVAPPPLAAPPRVTTSVVTYGAASPPVTFGAASPVVSYGLASPTAGFQPSWPQGGHTQGGNCVGGSCGISSSPAPMRGGILGGFLRGGGGCASGSCGR